jgi:hypothetical protein
MVSEQMYRPKTRQFNQILEAVMKRGKVWQETKWKECGMEKEKKSCVLVRPKWWTVEADGQGG